MKRYRKYIQSSKYLDEHSDEILFDDRITIDIEVDIPYVIDSSTHEQIIRFPGVEQFRQDVLDILENEYHFEVIEDMYNGKKQKGYFSNRDDSISVYFDTYLDLCNVEPVLKRIGSVNCPVPGSGKIYCFIHFRFSDHILNDEGDQLHRRFIADNADKYTSDRPDVTHVMKEECITLNERDVTLYYNEALEDLRDQIDIRMTYWARKSDRYKRRNS